MTYDSANLAADFFRYVKQLQDFAGNEAHALRLARALEIRVRVGRLNRVRMGYGTSAQIMVQPWWYGNSDVLRHEIAHVMLWWSGLEAEIIAEYGDELGWKVIENLCDYAVVLLKIPPPMVRDVVGRCGVSAQAVERLRRLSGAQPTQALHRLIYDDPGAQRAGFLTNGHFIVEVAQCNWSLPFGWLDRVPEPVRKFPESAKVSLLRLKPGQTLGVCWG